MRQAVEVKGVSKSFKRKLVLDSVSFSIRKGEIFGLLGPNGAGKTTIISCLCGLISPDSGECRILGKDPRRAGSSIFEDINFVSGTSQFHHRETPREILSYHASLFKDAADPKEIISLLEIEDFAGQEFGELSTGQKAKVLLAKSLLNRPKVLLLDEPTLGLDPEFSVKMRELIKRINREQGTTILLTSHYMKEVEELCGRIAFISSGRIVEIGTVSQIKKRTTEGMTRFIIVAGGRISARQTAALRKRGFSVSGRTLAISGRAGETAKIVSAVERAGLVIEDLSAEGPSLEESFISLARGGRE